MVRGPRGSQHFPCPTLVRSARVPGTQPIQLYKNNTVGKGASYGADENYLMDRRTPFLEIIRGLIPFFVTRQVVAGSGRVGIGTESRTQGFQRSEERRVGKECRSRWSPHH